MSINNGQLTKEEASELYNKFFRHRCFEILMDIQEMEIMLRLFMSDGVVHDKYNLVNDTLQIMHRDANTLISRVSELEKFINISEEQTSEKSKEN